MKKSELEEMIKAKDVEIESMVDAHERSKRALQTQLNTMTFQRDQLLITVKTLGSIYGQTWE